MKRFLKILLKTIVALLALVLISLGILYAVYNKPLPKGETGPAADALAKKMLKAINYEAYQNTRFLEWSFDKGAHSYKWDKVKGQLEVNWDDNKVILNLSNTSKNFTSKKETSNLHQKALDYFNNDSFWLVAPFKVFDQGTKRSIVKLEDGSDGLLVTYTSGGSTPGDSYLWMLNANGFPESYQMWVKIIPIGGIEATWDNWQVMESGVFLPTLHELGPMTLDMGKVRAYN